MLTTEEVIAYLSTRGYKYQKTYDGTDLLYKRLHGPICQTNKRSPSIMFEIHSFGQFDSMSVKIRAENNKKLWADIGFYGMDLNKVKKYKYFEKKLSSMWEILNEEKKN